MTTHNTANTDTWAHLEPQVRNYGGDIPLAEVLALSSAVSLKRIADALSGNDTWALNNLMENAGQAFALGMRGR